MGQQQLLLIVLSVIIISMAIYAGTRMFDYYNADSARERVLQEAKFLVQFAEQYKLRSTQTGGGGGSYTGFVLTKFFIDEPDIGYWVSGSGQNLQVYACSYGADAVKGEDGLNPVAVLLTKRGSSGITVRTLN
ncbi:MAG: hypothetical protein V1799_05735 [bacterium]